MIACDNTDNLDKRICSICHRSFFSANDTFHRSLAITYAIVADFNNDTYLGITVATTYTNKIAILLGHGDGCFSQPMTY